MLRVQINRAAITDLQNRVQQLQAELSLRLSEALDRYGSRVTERMRANHEANAHEIGRYINQTEDLSQSTGYTLEPPVAYADIIKHRVQVFAATIYAFDVEFGVPGRSKPYPFFWPEIHSEENTAAAQADVAESVDAAVTAVSEVG